MKNNYFFDDNGDEQMAVSPEFKPYYVKLEVYLFFWPWALEGGWPRYVRVMAPVPFEDLKYWFENTDNVFGTQYKVCTLIEYEAIPDEERPNNIIEYRVIWDGAHYIRPYSYRGWPYYRFKPWAMRLRFLSWDNENGRWAR